MCLENIYAKIRNIQQKKSHSKVTLNYFEQKD